MGILTLGVVVEWSKMHKTLGRRVGLSHHASSDQANFQISQFCSLPRECKIEYLFQYLDAYGTGACQGPRIPDDGNNAPATLEEFQPRLMEVSDTLPKRLGQCAGYGFGNTDRVAVPTVAELSAAGVQLSPFMRFCQFLGVSGFTRIQMC